MLVIAVQTLALLIQCASAFFAIRLIRVTNRYWPWLLITLSIMLIIPRRGLSYSKLLTGGLNAPMDSSVLVESILLLAISLTQAAGILLIGPFFRSIRQAQEELRRTNESIEQQVRERTQELAEKHSQLLDTHHKLEQTEALRDSLTDMIVHDLRTPLTSIYGYAQTLRNSESDRLSQEGYEYLDTIVQSTRNLTGMVSSLLDVSKMESGTMSLEISQWDMVSAAREVIEELEPLRGNREVTLLAPEQPVEVSADSDLMRRVLTNLLGNAIKYTPDNAAIAVGVEQGEDVVRVFVRDNGPGIPPEDHKRIFDKFGQVGSRTHARDRSTGLGLTFCKLAVEAHHGRIWLESEVGSGSTFWFGIPLRQPKEASVETATAQQES